MQSLNQQLHDINSSSKEQDKKLSNFLSTQLNTQSNILNLTNKLSQDGLLDSKTIKNIESINKGIDQLSNSMRKKNQNNEVVLDSKTRKFFEEINKDIKNLSSNLKKK